MTSPLRYFWVRIKPFLLVFLGCETAARVVLTLCAWKDLAEARWNVVEAMLVGFAFDLSVFTYFLIPMALYLACVPAARHGRRMDRIVSTALFFSVSYILIFCTVSEFIFWDEFQSRYNFIAVDYLVYTHEVIDNIRESYPVGTLMAAIALAALAISAVYHRRGVPSTVTAPHARHRAGLLLGAVALAAMSFVATKSSYADISPNRYVNEIARNGIFELFSAFRHNELSYDKFYDTLPVEKVAAFLEKQVGANLGTASSPLDHTVTARATGKKYNLVLITVESLSASYMTVFGNRKGITPHLDKLADESLFFTNLYATGTRTVYGLSAITLAMPPVPGNSIVRKQDNGGLASLGGVLQDKGYATKFIYGGFGYFDNMNEFFSANGYGIVDRSSLSKDEIHFANAWGVSDDDLYRRVMTENDKEFAAGRPFFDMIMTTSNHRPYTYPEGKIDIPSHTGRDGGVKFTDYTIHEFLEESKKRPWFKDTIFVIIADHTAGSAGKTDLDPAKYHIPMFVYAPGIVKPGKVDWMTSQIDVTPTLLGLMGVSYESRFYGKDALKTHPHRAFISNYQKLGYLTEDGLVILSPVQQSGFYDSKGVAAKAPPGRLEEAIAYYEGASKWRQWSKKP
ncbi:MAG: LTA synthase family protein [Alphaproteobacteria bacterium]|nr:MAG: LTA synthase family protein [Alphaproteobacteria bacterium]